MNMEVVNLLLKEWLKQIHEQSRQEIKQESKYHYEYKSAIHTEKSNKMQQYIKIFIIPYLHEAQYFSGNIPPIIRSLKLHWQPLVFLYVEGFWT
jgi:hypothetical protein